MGGILQLKDLDLIFVVIIRSLVKEKDGEEMYNLGNDPAYAERIRDMHEICKRFHKQHGDYFCWEEAEKKGENPSGG